MWSVFLRPILVLTALFNFSATYSQPELDFGTPLATGLVQPVDIAAEPGTGRLFIVQQGGSIRIFNGTSMVAGTFLSLNNTVINTTGNERGLLSMAFHPNYADPGNRYFFLLYTNPAGDITLARCRTQAGNPDQADLTTRVELMNIPKLFSNHNGGDLNFGPDGYLYFGTGDGGDGNDPSQNAQNGNSLLGKMLRINVNDFTIPFPFYTIPPDNPFAAVGDGVLNEIFALGLRNPWRWSFDRANGSMWIADVGQSNWEEVNYRPLDPTPDQINYGWRCREGNHANPGVPACTPSYTYVPPIFEYTHNNATGGFSITGGFVYRGSLEPELVGYYVCADYVSGNVWLVEPDGSFTMQDDLPGNISSFGEDNNGELYAVSRSGGTLYRVSTTGSGTLPLQLLSFSGKSFDGYNELKWTTDEEESVDRFIIEVSTDGRNFQYAGEVQANNSTTLNNYNFQHVVFDRQTRFYRLQIKHLNSNDTYSVVVRLNSDADHVLKIYPTVVTGGQLRVETTWPVNEFQLFNSEGRQVVNRKLAGAQGFFTVSLPSLPKGVYYVWMNGVDQRKSTKIIIQ